MYYCLASIGANGSNVISLSLSSSSSGAMQVWSVPLTSGTALFDTVSKLAPTTGTNPATASFNTAGTDEYVAIGVCTSGTWASEATAGGSYTLDGAAAGAGSLTHYAGEHFIYTSTQTGITPGFTQASSANYAIVAVAIKANPLFSISGTASAAATIHYSGTASGTVTADGSGVYSVPNLANGSYVLWATATKKSFSPLTSSQTVSGANITGVAFTPTTSIFGTPVVVNNTASASSTITATTNTAANDLIVILTNSDHSTAPTGIADTVGNTYVQAGTVTQLPTDVKYITMWYCEKSIGANASNVITVTYSGSTTGSVFVRNIPVTTGFKATFDVTQVGTSNTGTALATAAFTTTGSDEIVLVGAGIATVSGTLVGQNGYLLDNGGSGLTLERLGGQSVNFGATQTGITTTMTSSGSSAWAIRAVAFKATQTAWTISGNAGICTATVSYTGTASGSVTADSSGDYSIPLLAAGSYTITPSKTGKTFSPTSTPETVVASDITGVNFFLVLDGVTLTPVYVNTLTGADQNPLDPTNLDPLGFHALKVLNHVGLATINTDFCEAFYIGAPALSVDQYASFTIHAWVAAVDNEIFITIRDDGTNLNCYALSLFDNNDGTATVEVTSFVANVGTDLYLDAAATIPVACDSFTFAAVGTTLGLWKNTTLLFSVTNLVHSTGGASISLATPSPNVITNLTITNMVFGNAAGLVPPPTPVQTGGTEFGFSDDFMF
jgi:hypothetical protein